MSTVSWQDCLAGGSIVGIGAVAVLLQRRTGALHAQLRALEARTAPTRPVPLTRQLSTRPYKPELIILLRHGESEGNVDKIRYTDKGDPSVELTARGKEQARAAGEQIAELVGQRSVATFVSPYVRTRQTAGEVLKALRRKGIKLSLEREDPRLREREFAGTFQPQTGVDMSEAQKYSRFFWRPPGGEWCTDVCDSSLPLYLSLCCTAGESCADVYDRLSTFMPTLWRCFARKEELEDGVALIVTHGLTARVFAMRRAL